MLKLPYEVNAVLSPFAVLFTQPTWPHALLLWLGTLLCHGARRVTSALRTMGLSQTRRFEKYHRVLNRAHWNNLYAAKILLGLLVLLLPADYPLLLPIDDTLERRRGPQIKAKGYYRDACRSTEQKIVNCYGLKWVCLTLIVPLPWNARPWALPVMTVLSPSREANQRRGRPHKTPVAWAKVMLRVIHRWLKRPWILIGDGAFACTHLGSTCLKHDVTLISRLRLDAALYDFPTAPSTGKVGRPCEKGQRQVTLLHRARRDATAWTEISIQSDYKAPRRVWLQSGTGLWYSKTGKPLPIRWVMVADPEHPERTHAFFSTDLMQTPEQIVYWYGLRWSIEVTFEEARAHLGMETQRQWSDKAIAWTTPLLLGLFSLTCLMTKEFLKTRALPILSTAWYAKKDQATFSDVLAFVRRAIWASRYFGGSGSKPNTAKIPRKLREALLDQLAFAT